MNYETFAQEILEKIDTSQQEAEIFIAQGKVTNIEVKQGEVEKLSFAGQKGVGIRIIRAGRTGYAYTSDFSSESIDQTVAQAIDLAKTVDPDPKRMLPPTRPISGEDLAIFDPVIETKSMEEKIALAHEMVAAAHAADSRVVLTQMATYIDQIGEVTLVNSNRFSGTYQKSMVGAYLMALAAEEGDQATAFGFGVDTHWDQIDPQKIGTQAGNNAARMLGGSPMPTQRGSVVYSPFVGSQLLSALSRALNGEALQRNRSFLVGKMNSQVATDMVSLIDNGRLPRGIATAPFDGEGQPTKATKLIDEGIFQAVIHDHYSASIDDDDGTNSTGNASRSSHSALPTLSTTNFYLQPGPQSAEDLIAGVDKGLYVLNTMNTHSINPINGDYSVSAEGILIENGKLTRPVNGVTIAIPLPELLNNITAVANDLAFLPIMGSFGAPTFRVDNVMIGGTAA